MPTIRRTLTTIAAALAVGTTSAETVVVKAQGVRFIPDVIRASVGDVIAFRNMTTHSIESVAGMWPAGAPEMHSETGADYDYPIEREGVYVFKCASHWGARMGGVISVGEPADLEATLQRYETIAAEDKAAKPAGGLLKKFRERMAVH